MAKNVLDRLSVSSHSSRVSTPGHRESVSTNINPVFVDDPAVTKLNTQNYLRNEPKLNPLNSFDTSSTPVIIKDYSNDDGKFDKSFG